MSFYSDCTVIVGFKTEQHTDDVHFLMVLIPNSSYN